MGPTPATREERRLTPPTRRTPWRSVALFFGIAVLLAAPFNLGWATPWLRSHAGGTPLALWPFLPAAIGPLVAALLLRRRDAPGLRATTLLGVPVVKNVVSAALPILTFGALGGRFLLLAPIAVLYAVGEECGWRGYLADALAPLAPMQRYLVTGALWWVWHLRFATTFDRVLFPLIVLGSSVLLGHAGRASRSVIVPAGMHATVILLTADGTPTAAMTWAGIATLAGWMLIGAFWRDSPPGQAVA